MAQHAEEGPGDGSLLCVLEVICVGVDGYRKVSGWPITCRIQSWLAIVLVPFTFVGMEIVSRHNLAVPYGGVLIALLTMVPHEYLHALAAMRLGLRPEVHLRPIWRPHTQSEGVESMWEVPQTSFAPQVLTVALAMAASLLNAPVLAVAAIGHALASTGDYANTAYALWSILRPKTRHRLLLNGTGNDAGLYQR